MRRGKEDLVGCNIRSVRWFRTRGGCHDPHQADERHQEAWETDPTCMEAPHRLWGSRKMIPLDELERPLGQKRSTLSFQWAILCIFRPDQSVSTRASFWQVIFLFCVLQYWNLDEIVTPGAQEVTLLCAPAAGISKNGTCVCTVSLNPFLAALLSLS